MGYFSKTETLLDSSHNCWPIDMEVGTKKVLTRSWLSSHHDQPFPFRLDSYGIVLKKYYLAVGILIDTLRRRCWERSNAAQKGRVGRRRAKPAATILTTRHQKRHRASWIRRSKCRRKCERRKALGGNHPLLRLFWPRNRSPGENGGSAKTAGPRKKAHPSSFAPRKSLH